MTTAVRKRVKESVIVLLFFLFYKTFCGSQCRSKLSLRSLALLLYKAGCARQCHSKHYSVHWHCFLYKNATYLSVCLNINVSLLTILNEMMQI